MATPQLIVHAAETATQTSSSAVGVVRIGFGLLTVCGLYLAYVGWAKKAD